MSERQFVSQVFQMSIEHDSSSLSTEQQCLFPLIKRYIQDGLDVKHSINVYSWLVQLLDKQEFGWLDESFYWIVDTIVSRDSSQLTKAIDICVVGLDNRNLRSLALFTFILVYDHYNKNIIQRGLLQASCELIMRTQSIGDKTQGLAQAGKKGADWTSRAENSIHVSVQLRTWAISSFANAYDVNLRSNSLSRVCKTSPNNQEFTLPTVLQAVEH